MIIPVPVVHFPLIVLLHVWAIFQIELGLILFNDLQSLQRLSLIL